MPSRMDEIAARSAGSPSEYEANKRENDRLADTWRKQKTAENDKQKRRVETTVESRPEFGVGRDFGRDYHVERDVAVEPVVMTTVRAPVEYDEPPVDMVDYSAVPRTMDIPWSFPSQLAGLESTLGTMMIMLGKRMLVSIATTAINYALMEPLQQYGKGLPRATVLWHTGKVPHRTAHDRVAPIASSGTGYVVDDPMGLATGVDTGGFWDAVDDASEWVSEQVRSWFGFPGWLD